MTVYGAVGTAKFEVYPSAGQFRWRLIAANGEKVAASEAYTTRSSAHRSVEMIQRIAPQATVKDTY